ncbi:DUF1127 domain-containing protein [Pseudomonas boanensis]|uniref:DUF1127 domain-containing protein n=1 Tax=Metapseudomonas boanensis TaxID=2822138 RepID=A0ABS5XC92_9GAMM|nr:DUF1127 domain-containing protein [Pseudomonas boanensis]MBT8765310.1 DUF1127 domain-containing protein [Pseudomonas boanensis]
MKGQYGFVGTLHQGQALGSPSRDNLIERAWKQVKRWNQLARERYQLATLSDEMLKDIGLTHSDVMQESERPFWDDPLKK